MHIKGGTRKPAQPLAPPDTQRNSAEDWDKAASIAHAAAGQVSGRSERRYWKKAALHAERQAEKLRQQ